MDAIGCSPPLGSSGYENSIKPNCPVYRAALFHSFRSHLLVGLIHEEPILIVVDRCVRQLELEPLGEFKIIAGWDQQLFPSYIIATATIKDESKSTEENLLGDRNGLLGIELVAPNDQTPIEITIAGNEFIESSTLISRLPKKGVSYRVFPKIKYRYQQLSDCKQARAESFTFRVKLGDQKAEEKSTTITIHPIHDCPLAVLDGESVVDVAFTFAAYVNEQHPFVDKLLREALDIGVVDKFRVSIERS